MKTAMSADAKAALSAVIAAEAEYLLRLKQLQENYPDIQMDKPTALPGIDGICAKACVRLFDSMTATEAAKLPELERDLWALGATAWRRGHRA